LAGATPLQSFAAGAALCSTSLGTTFTILGTSGLTNTRLGTVLTSAAMMDDVVGLVMVQVISNLGSSSSSFSAITVVRPILVSIGFAVVSPSICRLVVSPFTIWLNRYRTKSSSGWVQQLLTQHQSAFIVHTTLLLAMVTGATYAGTSNLFAAYLAGAMVSWWDTEVPHPIVRSAGKQPASDDATPARSETEQPVLKPDDASKSFKQTDNDHVEDKTSGIVIYRDYYSKAVDRILKPFFFVSRHLLLHV
jgi:hypothetical protein